MPRDNQRPAPGAARRALPAGEPLPLECLEDRRAPLVVGDRSRSHGRCAAQPRRVRPASPAVARPLAGRGARAAGEQVRADRRRGGQQRHVRTSQPRDDVVAHLLSSLGPQREQPAGVAAVRAAEAPVETAAWSPMDSALASALLGGCRQRRRVRRRRRGAWCAAQPERLRSLRSLWCTAPPPAWRPPRWPAARLGCSRRRTRAETDLGEAAQSYGRGAHLRWTPPQLCGDNTSTARCDSADPRSACTSARRGAQHAH